jgi:MFS transporter, Spinster family, sphingosine-1-phosphate transporter
MTPLESADPVPADPAVALQASRRWTGRQTLVLALLLCASIFNYVDRQILPVLQELVKADLALSDGQLGLITGPAFAIFYSLAGLPIARIAERVNRARLLGGAVALWSGMTALCGAATSLPMLVAARFGVGLGEGGCVPTSHSLLSDTFPTRQRGMAMAVLSTAQPAAGVLTPLVGGFVAHLYGWRAAFVTLGVLGLLLALAIFVTLRDPRRTAAATPDAEPQRFGTDLRWLLRSRAFVWLFVAGGFMGIGGAGVTVFLVSFIMRVHELTLVQASSILAANGLMGLIGTFIGGYFADRYAGARGRSYPLVCAVGALLSAALYLLSFAQSSWTLAAALLLAAGIATDLKNGPNYAAVQNLVPSRMRATAAAVFMLAATLIGSGVGPPLAGVLSDHFAQAAFGSGDFAALCRGSGGLAESARCRLASAQGLETALRIVACSYFGAAFAFYMCSRSFRPHEDSSLESV